VHATFVIGRTASTLSFRSQATGFSKGRKWYSAAKGHLVRL